jgi:hypothetical protein
MERWGWVCKIGYYLDPRLKTAISSGRRDKPEIGCELYHRMITGSRRSAASLRREIYCLYQLKPEHHVREVRGGWGRMIVCRSGVMGDEDRERRERGIERSAA